ncbi:MAG TPA: type II secretion system protein GspG [Verrucomicrobiae bacterium]|nr:type II secretion system protein GspG [Verrucomicrobiae bacterium]
MKSLQRILLAAGIISVMAFILLAILGNPNHKPALNAICRLELGDIKNALDGYQSKYANYPAGNQSEIIRCLCGNNPERYQFLNIKASQLNLDKGYLDPWGSPFTINFSSTNSFVISSAGKDKLFDTKDDIIFNSLSNDFVKP